MGNWLPLILLALGGLFGGKKQEQQQTGETVTETEDRAWRDPSIAFLSPYIIRMLMSNLMSKQSAGMPQGYAGLGLGDWTNDVLRLLEGSWPSIMGELGEEPLRERRKQGLQRAIGPGSLGR